MASWQCHQHWPPYPRGKNAESSLPHVPVGLEISCELGRREYEEEEEGEEEENEEQNREGRSYGSVRPPRRKRILLNSAHPSSAPQGPGSASSSAASGAGAKPPLQQAFPTKLEDPTLHVHTGIIRVWGGPAWEGEGEEEGGGLVWAAASGGALVGWDPRNAGRAVVSSSSSSLGGVGPSRGFPVRLGVMRAAEAGGLVRATYLTRWGAVSVFSSGACTLTPPPSSAPPPLLCRRLCGPLSMPLGTQGEGVDRAAAVEAWGERALQTYAFSVGVEVEVGCQGAVLDFGSGIVAFPHRRTLRAEQLLLHRQQGGGGAGAAQRSFVGRPGEFFTPFLPQDASFTAVAVVDASAGKTYLLECGVGVTCLEACWKGEALYAGAGGGQGCKGCVPG